MEVIFTLLGVPDADRHQLREWTDVALERDPDTPAIPARALEASLHQMRYWYDLIGELRRRPNDGLMCGLFEAEVETDGGTTRLSDGEIIGFCTLLGAAGNETTTKLLANAAVLFARHPEEYRKILADPEFREKFLAPQMFEPMPLTPEEFAEYIRGQQQKWAKVIRAANLKIE